VLKCTMEAMATPNSIAPQASSMFCDGVYLLRPLVTLRVPAKNSMPSKSA